LALVQTSPDTLEKMNIRTGERTQVLTVEKRSISDASLSPDGKWAAYLTAEPDGRAAIWVAPISEVAGFGKQRILIIEDDRYLSPPHWSPNGHYLYFLSQKNDRWSIHAQKLDPQTKEPVGEAHEVYFSPETKLHLNFPIGNGMIGVAEDKIVFHACEMSGNIFLARPKSR